MARILIVDDRAISRQYLAELLGYAGHQVFEAADGVEALDLLRTEQPDLTICDILMPRMDGYELVRRVRAAPTGTSALAITKLVVPDLILLDVGLPELDAFGLVEKLRADATLCKVAVVVYTSRTLDHQDRARLELGKTEFFVKGEVELEQLERRVLQLLPVGAKR